MLLYQGEYVHGMEDTFFALFPADDFSKEELAIFAVLLYVTAESPHAQKNLINPGIEKYIQFLPQALQAKAPTDLWHARDASVQGWSQPRTIGTYGILSTSDLKGTAFFAKNLICPVLLPVRSKSFLFFIDVSSFVRLATVKRLMDETELEFESGFLNQVRGEREYIGIFKSGAKVLRLPSTL